MIHGQKKHQTTMDCSASRKKKSAIRKHSLLDIWRKMQ